MSTFSIKKLYSNDYNFIEWLRGFVDGEGSFIILNNNNRPFTINFKFKIKLHRDDRPVLDYLKKKLKIGTIYPKPKDSTNSNISVTWENFKLKEIKKLIKIFNDHPLNTYKQLDFFVMKRSLFNLC